VSITSTVAFPFTSAATITGAITITATGTATATGRATARDDHVERGAWYTGSVLAPSLVDVLVCPKSKQPLVYFPRGEADRDAAQAFLLCPASRLRYRVEEGVPVLLVEEATELSDADVDRLVQRAHELKLAVPSGFPRA
jgi:uncharacterized protein YbaR (Trm112 family)